MKITLVKTQEAEEEDETIPDVSFWRVLKLNKPEWKVVTVASISSLMSGFSMPLIAVIFGDFIGVSGLSHFMDQNCPAFKNLAKSTVISNITAR